MDSSLIRRNRALEIRIGRAEVKAPGASGIDGGIGLLARTHLSSGQSINDGSEDIIDFDTVDYDPGAGITTGAAWHFTVPTNGWYRVYLSNGYIEAGAVWGASTGLQANVYVNGSVVGFVGYHDCGAAANSSHAANLSGGTTAPTQLTAGDTIALKVDNFSGAARTLGGTAAIEIDRVA